MPLLIQAQQANQNFSEDLKQLQEYFHIPWMAALVEKDGQIVFEDYLGFSDIQDSVEVT